MQDHNHYHFQPIRVSEIFALARLIDELELTPDDEEYTLWRCPYCGEYTFQGDIIGNYTLEDVAGCEHWRGDHFSIEEDNK